jgi:uncharacterized protein (TIGR02246 family)
MSQPTMHDEVAIRQLVTDMTAAWCNHDGVAFGQPFREDAYYRAVQGKKAQGRQEIADAHAWLFNGIYKGTWLESTITALRFLRADVAYIEVAFRLHNVPAPDGSFEPARNAVAGATALKENGEWALATFNNANIPTAPE